MTPAKITVSGSFTKHLAEIQRAVSEFEAAGAQVLSPARPTVVDSVEGFVFVASDLNRSPRLVQDRHLAAIGQSNFLWLVCPDGYVGQSASLEIGYAVARGIPVWTQHLPNDLTLRQYVGLRQGCFEALQLTQRIQRSDPPPSLLVDPVAAAEEVHRVVSNLSEMLRRSTNRRDSESLARAVEVERRHASKILLPH
jgi:hypothetical protein